MKFGISGVHCTGKTTLIEELKKIDQLSNFKFITGQARKLKDKVKINEQANDDTQLAILEIASQTAEIKNSIDDRCIFDVLGYTLGLHKHNRASDVVLEKVIDRYKQLIVNYTSLFYLPAEIPFVPDGIRSEDLEWRNDLILIFEFLKRNLTDVPIHTITGSVEDRIVKILYFIDYYTH